MFRERATRDGNEAHRAIATAGAILALFAPRKRHHVRAYLHAEADPTAPKYVSDRAIWTLSVDQEPYPSGGDRGLVTVHTQIETLGWISAGACDRVVERGSVTRWKEYDRSAENAYAPRKGYWSLFAKEDHLRAILRGVPREAEIQFDAALDYGSNGACAEALVHVDHLYVRAFLPLRRKRAEGFEQRAFLLDVSAGPHNSARFGNGMWERSHG